MKEANVATILRKYGLREGGVGWRAYFLKGVKCVRTL